MIYSETVIVEKKQITESMYKSYHSKSKFESLFNFNFKHIMKNVLKIIALNFSNSTIMYIFMILFIRL